MLGEVEQEGIFMVSKIKTLVMGGLVMGSLALSAGSVFARDYWHWSEQQHRWDRRADIRSDYRDLNQEKRKIENDCAHHANRRVIARTSNAFVRSRMIFVRTATHLT